MARGCDGAELDVQLSADGVVVVHHDFRLDAGCGAPGRRLADRPDAAHQGSELAALQAFDIGRADPASDYARAHPDARAARGERIPTLEEVVALAQCGARAFLSVRGTEMSDGSPMTAPIRWRWRMRRWR